MAAQEYKQEGHAAANTLQVQQKQKLLLKHAPSRIRLLLSQASHD
jgi:hypothetical protein